jgi:hypothetical protein
MLGIQMTRPTGGVPMGLDASSGFAYGWVPDPLHPQLLPDQAVVFVAG